MSDVSHQNWPVWDWPVRLSHWYFPIAIVFMWWSGEEGHMQWHSWCGYSLLVVALTRITWGFVGSKYARFRQFLCHPKTVWRYVRGAGFSGIGHNPLGGYASVLLLLLLVVQASTGLASTDDILFDGPLAYWAGDWSPVVTQWHDVNWSVLMVAIAVHLTAVAFHTAVKKQPLISTMWKGQGPNRSTTIRPVNSGWAVLVAFVWSSLLVALISVVPVAPSYY